MIHSAMPVMEAVHSGAGGAESSEKPFFKAKDDLQSDKTMLLRSAQRSLSRCPAGAAPTASAIRGNFYAALTQRKIDRRFYPESETSIVTVK